jgi:hypothetical protein
VKIIEGSALSERLGEVIEGFSEANEVTVREVLDALLLTFACVQRYNDGTPAEKLH